MSKARELSQRAGVDGALSNRNLIINGAMLVSQRGDYTSAVSSGVSGYYLDRWFLYRDGVTANLQQTSTSPSGYGKSLKVTATSTATGEINIYQMLEGTTVDMIKGQAVTLSAWVRSNTSAARLMVYSGSSVTGWVSTPDAAHTGNGGWERLTTTFTVPIGAIETFRPYISIRDADRSSTSIVSGDYIEVTQVQLEVGDTATPFEHRSFGQELALCQRYFCTSGGPVLPQQTGYGSDLFIEGIGAVYSDSYAYSSTISFPCEMRTSPSVTIVSSSLSSANNQAAVYSRNGGWNTCDATNPNAGPSGMMLDLRDNSGFVGRDSCLYFVGWYADAEL